MEENKPGIEGEEFEGDVRDPEFGQAVMDEEDLMMAVVSKNDGNVEIMIDSEKRDLLIPILEQILHDLKTINFDKPEEEGKVININDAPNDK